MLRSRLHLLLNATLINLTVLAMALSSVVVGASDALEVVGSSTINPVVVEAAEILRGELGMEIRVDPSGGSSGGIAALGDGQADVAMVSRPLAPKDREKFPAVQFRAVRIGMDALALVVSADVWQAGVRSLSKEDMRAIYEGKIRRWSELGGPDRRIAFFNKEPGRGTWEVFAKWLYGSTEEAPLVSFPEVGANEEARNKVASTRGALSQLSASWADGERVFALSVLNEAGEAVAPTAENVASGLYPIGRSLFLLTDGEAGKGARTLIDFLLSDRGQALVEKHGYLAMPRVEASVATWPGF
jgi:phosphate transport system substrate-binding protein